MDKNVEIDGQSIVLNHLDKVFWPKSGLTKGELIAYYEQVSQYILPHLAGRPESMNRFPDGITGEHFFQKNLESHPAWVKTFIEPAGTDGHDVHYPICDSRAVLLYLINLGCIDLNVWNSRVEHPRTPDFMVFDLDPVDISFQQVLKVALAVKDILDDLGIDSYPKTSGKRGLHIYVPLMPEYSYDQVRDFAHLVALKVNNKLPKITSLERMPKSREGKVYLDYLQNREGATMAAPYSVRPVETANVSTPVTWEEVEKGFVSEDFNIKNAMKRLEKMGDIFAPVLGKGIELEKALEILEK